MNDKVRQTTPDTLATLELISQLAESAIEQGSRAYSEAITEIAVLSRVGMMRTARVVAVDPGTGEVLLSFFAEVPTMVDKVVAATKAALPTSEVRTDLFSVTVPA